MNIINQDSNLNTRLPLFLSIHEVDLANEFNSIGNFSAESCFNVLKKKRFNFNMEESVDSKLNELETNLDYNYSNFSLQKIQFSDFRHLDIKMYFEILERKIQIWSNEYKNMSQTEFSWFMDITKKKINDYAVNYSDVFLFDLDPQADHPKRHPYFSLYEFFISLIFVGNKEHPYRICYVILTFC